MPAWKKQDTKDIYPLQLIKDAKFHLSSDDELEISQFKLKNFYEIQSKNYLPRIKTKNGKTILSVLNLKNNSKIWAFGVPFNHFSETALFTFVLREIFISHGSKTTGVKAILGDNVKLNNWFGLAEINGQLTLPNKKIINVQSTLEQPFYLALNEPGVYKLKMGDEQFFQLVNYPRMSSSQAFDKKEWDEKRKNSQTHWIKKAPEFNYHDFIRVEAPKESRDSKRYDLSPLALCLFLLFILFESILLFRIWLRREAPRV